MGSSGRLREVALHYSQNEVIFVEVFTGEEMYKKLGWGKSKYGIRLSSNYLLKVESLIKEDFKERFYYINPKSKYEIVCCETYDDYWFMNSISGVSKKTLKLVNSCMKVLGRSGVSNDSLITLIKKEDGKYHLEIDFEDCGFLGDDSNDIEFKTMVTSLLKDIKYGVEVIVFPSKGEYFFFRDYLAVYDSIDKFNESLNRKRGKLNLENLSEKEIALDRVSTEV